MNSENVNVSFGNTVSKMPVNSGRCEILPQLVKLGLSFLLRTMPLEYILKRELIRRATLNTPIILPPLPKYFCLINFIPELQQHLHSLIFSCICVPLREGKQLFLTVSVEALLLLQQTAKTYLSGA